MDQSFGKIDIIIIIVLALLVAFIIGFNIIQIIDNKLNSVIINVPPQNCSLPQILVNFDKDNKPTKLNNDQINILNHKLHSETEKNLTHQMNNVLLSDEERNENFGILDRDNNLVNSNIIDDSNSSNSAELDQTVNTNDSYSNENFDIFDNSERFGNIEIKENYGSLPDKYAERDDQDIDLFAQKISNDLGNSIIDNQKKINIQDPNYNTIDNYPYLIDPDDSKKGYYQSRVKLISDSSSPLIKLEEKNMQKINQVINSCIKNQPIQKVDATYDGYNKFPNLQAGSYANFTSIGKSLLTPYTSYPVPS